jgi:hopanoid biosynthesis associated protein HpnK
VAQLIVNADDFGLTAGINRAIAELHQAGLLTSTTLMARAPATEDAIQIALSTPSLGVGCHIVLVDGEPVLPPEQIPTLIDPATGHFRSSIGTFLVRLLTGRINPSEIEAEAAAQIALLESRGLRLTHIDTHKHAHMFPTVLRSVLRAARAAGLQAVRNPFEPSWAIRATAGASLARAFEVTLLRYLQPICRRIIAEEQFATTEGTIAVVGTGVLNLSTARSLLRQLPAAGIWELVTHPGYNDAELAKVHTRLRESREIERQALSATREFPDIHLISYRGLRSPAAAIGAQTSI